MEYTSDILTDSFLSPYKTKKPNWGYNGLGEIVYKRTYSRIKDDGTSEEWWETVARCINGAQKIGAKYSKKEAQKLYDYVFNLKCNFAGRMLWQLGTSTVDRFGGNSLLNCFAVCIRDIDDFCFIFENLMLGGGVGFSIRKEDIHELPRIKEEVKVKHEKTNDADFIVPDSRRGWVKLLKKVLKSYFCTGESFTYSTALVRSKGEIIRGFGGKASGPGILIEGIENICGVLKSRESKKLRSIDVLDICNIIGSVVVAGNVRRCLSADTEILTTEGNKSIADINIGDSVVVASGESRQVTNKFSQGEQEVFSIKTSGGIIEATKNHTLLVYDIEQASFTWKSVSNLDIEKDKLIRPKL